MLTAAIASARGAPTLAVGNVIGTNVTIVTLALGLSALIFPLNIDRHVRRQALMATLVSIIPGALLFLGVITQREGVLLWQPILSTSSLLCWLRAGTQPHILVARESGETCCNRT